MVRSFVQPGRNELTNNNSRQNGENERMGERHRERGRWKESEIDIERE